MIFFARGIFIFVMDTGWKCRSGLSMRRLSVHIMVFVGILIVFALGACQRTQTADTRNSGDGPVSAGRSGSGEAGPFYKPEDVNCSLFTVGDASAILGAPAESITVKSGEAYPGFWTCSYRGGGPAQRVAFSIKVATSIEEAEAEMESYRSHLKTAGERSSFKEKLPEGAYSEIGDLGDEAVWTDMNLSLTVRQGNISIRTTMPKVKMDQIKVAQKFLSRL
jgi:hypothetical protein